MTMKPSIVSADKPEAITLLMEDHKNVKKLFKEFERIKDGDNQEAKNELVQTICTELTIHARIEEEIFYPAAREALIDVDILDEAEVEHACAKELIAQLEVMEPNDELYDAKVTVLGEYVNHHIHEEQEEIFTKVKKSNIDRLALGMELKARKEELQEVFGIDQPGGDYIKNSHTGGVMKSQSRHSLRARSY